MPEALLNWDPDEWEDHVQGLLSEWHGVGNVQRIPSKHKGDWGIDYLCHSAQSVYQCYAVQEPCEVATRSEKQIAKITEDVGKFCDNKTALSKLFGTTKINRWALVVPLHDSANVNAHLTKKTQHVLGKKLAYVANDFEATIHCLKSFENTAGSTLQTRRLAHELAVSGPTKQEKSDWASQQIDLVDNLRGKLLKRANSGSSIASDTDTAIGWFLQSQNTLEQLRSRAPELHEHILKAISRYADRLRLAGPSTTAQAAETLRTEIDLLFAELKRVAPLVPEASIHDIVMGVIAEWLMRCPLDFPPYG